MSVTIHKGDGCDFLTNQPVIINKINNTSAVRKRTMRFQNSPRIIGRMSVVGDKEGKGPLGEYFHKIEKDAKLKEKTFERAEIRMLDMAIRGAISNANLDVNDVDLILAGDLLNQTTSSNYVARDLNIPFTGLYSACATMSESLALGAAFVNAGYYDTVACATVSHFATAERQFRYPLEYGCQRPPYAQWTATAAGCSILSATGDGPKVTMALVGKVVDFGTNDLNNMGAAMAPAAVDTLLTLFEENNMSADDFDMIFTGDLGKLGSDILRDLMAERGYNMGQKYSDCGAMIYDSGQNCYQGGSGCGCSASVFNAFVLEKLNSGEFNRVALLATGALMSTQSCYQGETIPCICHAVVIER